MVDLLRPDFLSQYGGFYDAYVCVRDVKGLGTMGGGFTNGAWRTRVINNEQADTANICALAGNRITLAAGTYRCLISAPAFRVDNHQARLYNVTDAAVILEGTPEVAAAADTTQDRSFIMGRFTVAAGKALEVQHQCLTTRAVFGFGVAASFANEIYTKAEFWRELPGMGAGGMAMGDFTLWEPDASPVAPSALDDEFDDSAFDAVLWTEFDPANDLTLTEVEEGLRFDQITDPGDDWSGIYQGIPDGNFTITALLNPRFPTLDYEVFSLILWEDATNVNGDLWTFGLLGTVLAPMEVALQRFADYQTGIATVAVTTGYEVPHVYVRIRRTGTTYGFDYSVNGHGWTRLHSGALTFVPTHFGIGINNVGTGVTLRGVASFFRYKNSDIGFVGSLEGDRVDGWRA